jgi:hypothetical protein
MSEYLPNQMKEHSPVNPKLGIKSSLPKIDELILLTILLWKVNNNKSEVIYSFEDNKVIKIDNDVLSNILGFFNSDILTFTKNSDSTPITLPSLVQQDIINEINNNPLFIAQFEHIFVGISLFLKIATIKFTNESFPDSKERTGGIRFQKKLEFTMLMDILDYVINSNIVEFKALCLNVIFKKDIKINNDYYKSLKKILTVFTENTIFKLRNDSNESIFNQEGIYSLLSEDKDVIGKDSVEDAGTVRVLKNYINSNLNPYIKIESNKFVKEEGITNEFLSEYVKRINSYLAITPIKYDLTTSHSTTTPSESTEPHEYGSYKYKNVLLKGVPGTGKSHKIDYIIENELKIIHSKNKLRINIHAASSNSDLLQGIGINSDENGNIVYLEKQGIILKFIITAIMNPNEPFALVLEEIQENSLNELIGDLIYLLEETKRTDIKALIEELGLILEDFIDYQELLDEIISQKPKINYVQIPYLIESEPKFRNFILPTNLYLFFTSNYRDDKKVIEDNLLRRIATFEIFPKYKDKLGNEFKNEEVSDFLKDLNDSIINQFKDREVHPDRFLIGHANWLKVEHTESFYESLLKVIIEFQDIKELYFSDVNEILKGIKNYPPFLESDMDNKIKEAKTYFDIIELLQDKIF